MKIKKEYKVKIAQEFKNASKYMLQADTPQKKLYFFSATYGILNRILNLEYDTELLFIDFILHRCYDAINSIVVPYMRGEIKIPMPDLIILLDKIAEKINALGDAIEKDGDYIKILMEIVELSYTTTGNGAYLYYKGLINI